MLEIQQQNSVESERGDMSTYQSEYPFASLVHKIQEKVDNLGLPLSSECCIYRIPRKLREVNGSAYTPQLVCIGPLHHGKKSLKKMENHKLRYLKNFLLVFEHTNMDNEMKLRELVSCIKEKEIRIRQCYAETFDYFSSDKFVEMVLLDSVFIIELFMRNGLVKPMNDHDFISSKVWLKSNIEQDLILLENQLPFFIIKDLYDRAFEDFPLNIPSFSQLTLYYFCSYNSQNKPFREGIKHFTDLLRYFQLPSSPQAIPTQSCFSDCYKHLTKLLPIPSRENPQSRKIRGRAEHLYSASELHEAGVNFKVSSSNCLLEIKFHKGELEMPCFKLYDTTEAFIRNIMALEQCHYPYDAKICDYMLLMDYLINTSKDVELLVQKKIMVNWIGDPHAVATIINKLGLHILEMKENHYSNLVRKLNAYYEVPHHSWKATLKHEYFRSPWRSASTIAAIILLVLTAIQTICSVIAL